MADTSAPDREAKRARVQKKYQMENSEEKNTRPTAMGEHASKKYQMANSEKKNHPGWRPAALLTHTGPQQGAGPGPRRTHRSGGGPVLTELEPEAPAQGQAHENCC